MSCTEALHRKQPRPGEQVYELLGYHNENWDHPYRVVLVIVDNTKKGQQELFANYFFLATNYPNVESQIMKDTLPLELKSSPMKELSIQENRSGHAPVLSPREVLNHYRPRGAFEDRIGEWNALGVNLSLDDFYKNEVILLLSFLAFNLAGIIRGELESASDPRANPPSTPQGSGWDMGRVRNVGLKVGVVLYRGGRRLWFGLAQGLAPLWQAVMTRVARWRLLFPDTPHLRHPGFKPLPPYVFSTYTPRL